MKLNDNADADHDDAGVDFNDKVDDSVGLDGVDDGECDVVDDGDGG